mgnify:CR=1 FL=1
MWYSFYAGNDIINETIRALESALIDKPKVPKDHTDTLDDT